MAVLSTHQAAASARRMERSAAVKAVATEFHTAGPNCGEEITWWIPAGVILDSMERIGRITQRIKKSAIQLLIKRACFFFLMSLHPFQG